MDSCSLANPLGREELDGKNRSSELTASVAEPRLEIREIVSVRIAEQIDEVA
jgi:hypothetical protein